MRSALADNPLLLALKPRCLIAIQTQSTTLDSYGQPSSTWSTVLTTWGSIDAIAARELYASGTLASQVTHEIKTRWVSLSITAGMRVLYANHNYQIQAVENVLERNRVLKLLCLAINDPE